MHFGLESGSDSVLSMVSKGVTRKEQLDGCLKTKEAGLSCSVYIMPGLGGAALSEKHAEDTASLLDQIAPGFIRIRTLEVFPQTPLMDALQNGTFQEASEEKIVREIRAIITGIDSETEILSDSASNLLPVYGRLPDDREEMLRIIDSYLDLSPREKIEYSFNSRLQHFVGQYGLLSDDLALKKMPFEKNNNLDLSGAGDDELISIIGMIRSRLMP